MSALSQIQVGSTVYDIQAVEYIVGTQASATLNWTGVTESSSLEAGKVIAYKLPYAESNNLGRCTLNLTLSGGGTTGAKNVIDAYYAAEVPQRTSSPDQIANKVYLLIYDGTAWQYLGGGAGGDSLPEYTVADKGKVLKLSASSNIDDTEVIPYQTVTVSGANGGAILGSLIPNEIGGYASIYLPISVTFDGVDYDAHFTMIRTGVDIAEAGIEIGNGNYITWNSGEPFLHSSNGSHTISAVMQLPQLEPVWENELPPHSSEDSGKVLKLSSYSNEIVPEQTVTVAYGEGTLQNIDFSSLKVGDTVITEASAFGQFTTLSGYVVKDENDNLKIVMGDSYLNSDGSVYLDPVSSMSSASVTVSSVKSEVSPSWVDAETLPPYTDSDKGKVLTLGETEGETIVVVPEQEVDGNDPLVGVTIEPTDIPLGTTGVFTAQEGNFEPKIAECVYQYDSDYGIYGFWTDEPHFENYVVVYDGNNWHQAIYDGLVTVSLTITNTSVEPKWETAGGGAIVTTSENFVKTVTATTTTLSVAYVNGTELVINGGGTVVSGITTTTGSAVTAVDNDSNIANAYGEYF